MWVFRMGLNSEDYSLFSRAVHHWGKKIQAVVTIEELSELQKELTKWLRGNDNRQNIIEEMVDVLIMIDQISLIFSIEPQEIDHFRTLKINRLKGVLDNLERK